MSVVDVHTHAFPLPLLDWLAQQGLAERGDGVVRLDPVVSGMPKGAPIPLPAAQYDLGARLADMARTGVTRQLVSVPPFVTCADATDETTVLDIVRRGNDTLAELLAGHRGVLDPLGYVPLGTEHATEEARYCLEDLACAGIAIGTRGLGAELDDPVHEPLWAYLADWKAFVFLHPNSTPGGARLADYWLPQLAGFPMETALAGSRLVLGGVLERHDVAICLAHGGGCLPALRGRLDLGWSRKAVARTTPHPPSTYLRRLYYDTATFSTPLLRGLVEDVGADHVLVGTDYPFELADADPLGTVAALALPRSDTAMIEAGTITGLLAGSA